MWITRWFKKLRKSAPKVLRSESFEEFFNRLVIQPIEELKDDRTTVKSFFTEDLTVKMCTLSPFGADVVSPYVNQEFVLNAKAHYFAGYSGNRMPKVLFNTHKAELEFNYKESLPKLPEFTGTFSEEYSDMVRLVTELQCLYPLMYYKSRDIEVTFTQFIYSVYRLIYDIKGYEIQTKDELTLRMQDIYLRATDLMYPLSVKGYTMLLDALPTYMKLRMVSIKVKSRLTVQHKYSAPPKRS